MRFLRKIENNTIIVRMKNETYRKNLNVVRAIVVKVGEG